jgi:hypothetical protein
LFVHADARPSHLEAAKFAAGCTRSNISFEDLEKQLQMATTQCKLTEPTVASELLSHETPSKSDQATELNIDDDKDDDIFELKLEIDNDQTEPAASVDTLVVDELWDEN